MACGAFASLECACCKLVCNRFHTLRADFPHTVWIDDDLALAGNGVRNFCRAVSCFALPDPPRQTVDAGTYLIANFAGGSFVGEVRISNGKRGRIAKETEQ